MEAYLREINRFSTDTTPLENGDGSFLTAKQEKMLPIFRQQLKDVLDDELHSDRFIVRFLIAENFDMDKAVVMLRAHLQWREKNRVDAPLDELLSRVPTNVREYICPPSFAGETKEGYPIFWDFPGRLDVQGILKSCKPEDIVQYHGLVFMEHVYDRLRQQSAKHNKLIDKMVVVQDLSHIKIRAMRPFFPVLSQITALRNANYPQVLKTMIVINAPTMIDIAWNLVKGLLRERTRRKIVFVKSSNAVTKLQNLVDENNLPQRYGGKMQDPSLPIPVPESAHLSASLSKSMDRSLTVAARCQHTMKHKLQLDDVLSWTFEVAGGKDIGVGVRMEGSAQWLVDVQRMDSTMIPIMGSVTASQAGVYELVLDNSYSWTTAKTMRYNIAVTNTVQQLEEAAQAEAQAQAKQLEDLSLESRSESTSSGSQGRAFASSLACNNLASV
eukprot:TRINITY_DN6463_c1_g1_i3.p1 TRINITY_DN6463_c1_g1~~TRINITY_DN6463_c1_g1_i3.p1  ORF type:complete len:442 (+),score=76.56 TRINITY_DN6463_c1_g1_i3:146-1471(+)